MKKRKTGRKGLKSINWVFVACMVSIMIMVFAVVGSMFFFRYEIAQSSDIMQPMDYQSYENYYVMITDGSKSAFWQNVYDGASESAQQSGAYVEMLGTNLSVEYDKYDLTRIAIDSKADGIIVEADESIRMTELIQEARDAKIPVVTMLSDNTGGGRQSFVGISSYNLGREYGRQVCEIAKEKGQQEYTVMVLFNTDSTDTSQNTILTAMQEMIGMQQIDEQITVETASVENDSAFAAEESIRDIFMTYDELPDIIVCLNEQNTSCVYQAVVDYNKVGDVEIVGYYESETILSAIQKNIIHSSITVDARQMGSYCVEALNEYKEIGYVSDYFAVDTSLINAQTLAQNQEGAGLEETD